MRYVHTSVCFACTCARRCSACVRATAHSGIGMHVPCTRRAIGTGGADGATASGDWPPAAAASLHFLALRLGLSLALERRR